MSGEVGSDICPITASVEQDASNAGVGRLCVADVGGRGLHDDFLGCGDEGDWFRGRLRGGVGLGGGGGSLECSLGRGIWWVLVRTQAAVVLAMCSLAVEAATS